MYKSPIEIIQGQLQVQLEGTIMKAVQQQDVIVDKDELIRALQYDRDQYEKGYADAMKNRQWIPVTELLPAEDTRVLVWIPNDTRSYTKMDTDRLHEGKWVRWGLSITHWMPLPEPPKE